MNTEILKIVENDMSHLPDFISYPIANLSHISGLPSDQLRLVMSIVIAIPFGWLHRFVPGIVTRHITNILLGVFFCYSLVGWTFLHIVALSFLIYFLIEVILPQSTLPLYSENEDEKIKKKRSMISSKRSRAGFICFAVAMLYLSISHIYRIVIDYMGWSMDFTGPLMIVTLKVISYAWNRIDGETTKVGENLDPNNSKEALYRSERAITNRASILHYLGWIFFFPGVLSGPMIEFNEYVGHIDGSLYKKRFGLDEPPFSFTAPLVKLGYALLLYPGMILAGLFPISGYVNTDAFYAPENSTLYRLFYVVIFTAFSRFKYYFVWYLAEAGCVATGIGLSKYDHKTKTAEWEACSNCNALICETANTMPELVNNWNIRVSDWLKHTIYLRVTEVPPFFKSMSPRSFANITTKLTSAFWHGFYPGYYIFFLHAWVAQEVENALRSILLPFFSKPNPENPRRPIMIYPLAYIYTAILRVFTLLGINYGGAAFIMLEFTGTFRFFKDNYFIYYIFAAIIITFAPRIVKMLHGSKNRDKSTSKSTLEAKKSD